MPGQISVRRPWLRPVGSGALVLALVVVSAFGLRTTLGQGAAPSAKDTVEKLLKDFAAAVDAGDLAAAQRLFATEEDVSGIFPPGAIKESVANIQSRLKLVFPDYVAALKEFGKHDLYRVDAGSSILLPKDSRGNLVELRLYEAGSIEFLKDTNALIVLRFHVGGIMQGAKGRWVFTNLTTRKEFFAGAKGG